MNLYLEVLLWWLIVPATAVTFMDECRHQAEVARLWDDKTGVDEGKPGRGLTAIDGADPRPGSRASLACRRTGQAGAVIFPREWVTARTRPFDQEAM